MSNFNNQQQAAPISYPPPGEAYSTSQYVTAPPPMGYPSQDAPQQRIPDQTTTRVTSFEDFRWNINLAGKPRPPHRISTLWTALLIRSTSHSHGNEALSGFEFLQTNLGPEANHELLNEKPRNSKDYNRNGDPEEYFTTRKRKSTIMVALSGVTQGKKETLRAYFDRFTKVVVAIEGTNESLKCLIFEKGLRPDNTFQEKLITKKPII
ncbi:hypothetical protein KIW84_010181 [Lathyrus oleraceus]|uniref:Retrotransposon gag domain-containing protein n=1 Tax=Pisum sativum TaxID=3888 RepID=A0A9D4YLE7_PEA|nr:hypothetical protein KIW84_010181 [Pisum sativum]